MCIRDIAGGARVADMADIRSRPRRPGASLVIAGLLGIAFFWLTDPRYGWAKPVAVAGDNPIDAAHYMLAGTVVGVAGSVVILLIGLWLMTRRAG